MKKKLGQTGLYNITDDSNTALELNVLACGIDGLYEAVEQLERECHIMTAESFGLELRESFVGESRKNLEASQRRELLCSLEQQRSGCTPSDFEKMLLSCGLKDFTVTEDCENFAVTINISDSLDAEQKAFAESRINSEFPLHLEVTVTYGG